MCLNPNLNMYIWKFKRAEKIERESKNSRVLCTVYNWADWQHTGLIQPSQGCPKNTFNPVRGRSLSHTHTHTHTQEQKCITHFWVKLNCKQKSCFLTWSVINSVLPFSECFAIFFLHCNIEMETLSDSWGSKHQDFYQAKCHLDICFMLFKYLLLII